ncbi:MAG TPA: HPP family protein [Acidobacteriaceae bacterium]
MSLAAWLSHQPLIFASLGPTAFEQIETPLRPSARPYNVVVGHLIAVLAGFAALFLTHAWTSPAVSPHHVTLSRVEAAVLSSALTVLGTLLARATQPAATATTLLISLGLMRTWQDGVYIMLAVLLMTVVGEPLRRWRAREHGGLDTPTHRRHS